MVCDKKTAVFLKTNPNMSKKSSTQDTETKPKRPITPYFRFATKKRASVKEANPSKLVFLSL